LLYSFLRVKNNDDISDYLSKSIVMISYKTKDLVYFHKP